MSTGGGRSTTHYTLLSQVHHSADSTHASTGPHLEPVDRITRYAKPNRYDTLDVPTSFLDSRRARSKSSGRGAKRADTPERFVDGLQVYRTSFSAVTQQRRRPPGGLSSSQELLDVTERPHTLRQLHSTSGCSTRNSGDTHVSESSTSGGAKSVSSLSGSMLSEVSEQVQKLTLMQESVREMLRARELEKERECRERLDRQIGKSDKPPLPAHRKASAPQASAVSNGVTFMEPTPPPRGASRNVIQPKEATHNHTLRYQAAPGSQVTDNKQIDSIASQMGLLHRKEESRMSNSVSVPGADNGPDIEQLSSGSPRPSSASSQRRGRPSLLGGLLRRLSPRFKRRAKSASPARLLDEVDVGASSGAAGKKEKGLARFFHIGRRSGRFGRAEKQSSTKCNKSKDSTDDNLPPAGRPSVISDISHDDRSANSSGFAADIESGHEPDAHELTCKILSSLERDRVPDPYNRFKEVSKVRRSSTENCVAGAGSSPASRPVKLNLGSSSTVTATRSCTSTPLNPEPDGGAAGAPRYLNLSVAAFGYGSYYKTAAESQTGGSSAAAVRAGAAVVCGSGVSSVTVTPGQEDLPSVPTAREPPPALVDKSIMKSAAPNGHAVAVRPIRSVSSPTHHQPPVKARVRVLPTPDGDCPPRTYGSVSSSREEAIIMRRRKTKSASEDPESRKRSSLIMMAVAHNSPRGKLDLEHSASLRLSGAPPQLLLTQTSVQETKESSSESLEPAVPAETSAEPCVPAGGVQENVDHKEAVVNQSEEMEHDGRYFLEVVDKEEKKIMKQVDAAERDLQNPELTEEVAGILRAAAGKGRLLIKEKLAQFRGLCDENLNAREDAPFVTRSSDLEGFWAMCGLQLDDLQKTFEEVDNLRTSQWILPSARKSPVISSTPARRGRGGRPGGRGRGAPPCAQPAKEDNARAEARRRLLAAKKEAMRRKQQQQQQSEDIVIFA